MANIENVRRLQPAHLQRDLKAMDDATLQAQEITQKAAIHCLQELQQQGVTPENVEAFLTSLRRLGVLVTDEIRRRGLAIVDVAPDCSCEPGRCNGPIGVRCLLSGFIVDRDVPLAIEDWQVGLWHAINEYTAACGGNTSASIVSFNRMSAVAKVNQIVRHIIAGDPA